MELSDCIQYYNGLKFLEKHGFVTNSKASIGGDIAFKIYETLGLREDDIESIADIKGNTLNGLLPYFMYRFERLEKDRVMLK